MCGKNPGSNMTKLGNSSYRIGKVEFVDLTTEEGSIVGTLNAHIFTRAFHNGVMFHSRAYSKSDGKRNNTVCSYLDEHNQMKFGEMQKFIDGEEQMVIVKEMTTSPRSLLSCAGNPC